MAQAIPGPSASQIGQTLAENGRVLATLDDWRAMGFLVVIFFIFFGFIIFILLRATRQERKEMSEERTRMWAVAATMGSAADKLAVEMRVQAALLARVEGALTRNESASNGRT